MNKIYACFSGILFLFLFQVQSKGQCIGGRYHDLVFPGNPTVTSDVVYGNNTNYLGANEVLKLDVYRPACDTATRRALVVFAHGGSFVTGDKADPGYVATATALAQLGYVVASINYRLGFPQSQTDPQSLYGFNSAIIRGMHDAKAAIRFMRNSALNGGNPYGIDPAQIFFGGVSAGGIMALHLAYQNTSGEMSAMNCNNQPGSECNSVEGTSNGAGSPINNISSSVRGIISISGGIRDVNWITTNDIPCCLAHGTVDGTVPYGNGCFGIPSPCIFPVAGSSVIDTRCAATGTTRCFKPMYGQDHIPANPAYVDTIATLMRNFLESFVCTTALSCNYTSSPATLSPTVSIAITSGSNPSCTGQPVTFTATAANGGTNLSYQWKKGGNNVGTNSPTYTLSTPANGDVITCVLTTCANPTPATSNAITMTVTTAIAPTVNIALTSGSNPSCTGAALTFTATGTNGGNGPSYQWKVNSGNVGTNSSTYTTSSLANGNVVSCVMTSNSSCANPTTATSNNITVTVNSSVTPSVSVAITDGTNPTCVDSSITFAATPTNGGATPSYQWKKNSNNIGTGSTYTSSSLTNGDAIMCIMTSSSSCANPTTANSNTFTIQTFSTPVITKAGNVLTSNIPSGNQWYRNGVLLPGATGQSYTATVNGTYTVTNSGVPCYSAPVTVIVSGIYDNEDNTYSLVLFPNPATNNVNISFTTAEPENFFIKIQNTTGAVVYSEATGRVSGEYVKQIELTGFPKGAYAVSVRGLSRETTRRFVVY